MNLNHDLITLKKFWIPNLELDIEMYLYYYKGKPKFGVIHFIKICNAQNIDILYV